MAITWIKTKVEDAANLNQGWFEAFDLLVKQILANESDSFVEALADGKNSVIFVQSADSGWLCIKRDGTIEFGEPGV